MEWGSERQAQVAEIVRAQGHAKVEDLAQRFSVTTQTIRKDINQMCARGLLRRVHGGVELAGVTSDHYALRRILNITAKRAIGQLAAELIPGDVTLAVSIGTTPELVVSFLGQRTGLSIFTNNLHLAMNAHRLDGVRVTIPGGQLRESEADIVGPSAVAFFDSYRFDFGLFGVAAVDADGGLLDFSDEDVHSREAIARNAKTRILVLDRTKFGRSAHARSGRLTDVDHVVTDVRPPEPLARMIEDAGVALHVAEAVAA